MLLGLYKSYEELEDNLTIAEMNLLLKAKAKDRENHYKVLAAFQGHKWGDSEDEGSAEDAVERLKKKAELRASGIDNEEEIELAGMGIKFG